MRGWDLWELSDLHGSYYCRSSFHKRLASAAKASFTARISYSALQKPLLSCRQRLLSSRQTEISSLCQSPDSAEAAGRSERVALQMCWRAGCEVRGSRRWAAVDGGTGGIGAGQLSQWSCFSGDGDCTGRKWRRSGLMILGFGGMVHLSQSLYFLSTALGDYSSSSLRQWFTVDGDCELHKKCQELTHLLTRCAVDAGFVFENCVGMISNPKDCWTGLKNFPDYLIGVEVSASPWGRTRRKVGRRNGVRPSSFHLLSATSHSNSDYWNHCQQRFDFHCQLCSGNISTLRINVGSTPYTSSAHPQLSHLYSLWHPGRCRSILGGRGFLGTATVSGGF